MSSNLFRGGVPTAPDVQKLMERFTELPVDTIILSKDIADTIGVDPHASRYRTVVNAWRRRLLVEKNIDMDAVSGVGFKILTEPERVRSSVRDYRGGARKIGKSVRRVSLVRTEKLAVEEQTRTEHAVRLMQGGLTAVRNSTKEIAVRLTSPETNPRLGKG